MTVSHRLATAQQKLLKQHLQQFPKDIGRANAVNLDIPLVKNISRRTGRPKTSRVFTPTVLIRRSKCTGHSLAFTQGPIEKQLQD